MSEGKPTITFGPSTLETMLEQFGWEVDRDGYVVEGETMEPAPTFHGDPIQSRKVGGVVTNDVGEAVLIRDNFVDMINYVSEKQ